jgi:hypothetical protein
VDHGNPDNGAPTLLYLIGRIDRVVRRHIDEVVGSHGLSVNQYTTMSVLEHRSGCPTRNSPGAPSSHHSR